MQGKLLTMTAGSRSLPRQGFQLRLLSARELLEAKAEGEALGDDTGSAGLRHNAAVLSRAAVQGKRRLFDSAGAVLEGWSAEKIADEMSAYRSFSSVREPDWSDEELVERLRKELGQDWEDRLRWKVLRYMGVLPSEQRAREMSRNDYLYCAMEMMLDREEQLEGLCPDCRSRMEEWRCRCCGKTMAGEQGENPEFDWERFEEMKQGG